MPATFYTSYNEAMFQRAVTYLQVILQEEEVAARHSLARLMLSQGWALLNIVIVLLVLF